MDNLENKMENVAHTLKSTTILYDVFLILGALALFLCLVLFALGAIGQTQFVDYTYTLGYLIILIIIIYIARDVYKEIHYSFKEKCDGDDTAIHTDFIIESNNRLYSIFSFVYYYTKTYIIVLFYVAMLFLGLFIFFIMLRSNVLYKDTWIKNKINEYWDSEQPIYALFIVYLVLALLMGIYLFFMSYVYVSEKILGRRAIKPAFTSGTIAGGFIFAIFLILLLPGLLYYLDLYTDMLRLGIQRARYFVYDNARQEIILRYPLLELFKQHNVFESVNFTRADVVKRYVRIFIFGLLISVFFAFLILPQFDVERYCHLRLIRKSSFGGQQTWTVENQSELDRLHVIAQQYQARFKMGYFVVIALVVFYHMIELTKDAIFRYFWSALKSKKGKDTEQLKTVHLSIDGNLRILQTKYDELLKAYRKYKDVRDANEKNNANNANNSKNNAKQRLTALRDAEITFKEKFVNFTQKLIEIYESYLKEFIYLEQAWSQTLSQTLSQDNGYVIAKLMTAFEKIEETYFFTKEEDIEDKNDEKDQRPDMRRIMNVDSALINSRQAKKLKKMNDLYISLNENASSISPLHEITDKLREKRQTIESKMTNTTNTEMKVNTEIISVINENENEEEKETNNKDDIKNDEKGSEEGAEGGDEEALEDGVEDGVKEDGVEEEGVEEGD